MEGWVFKGNLGKIYRYTFEVYTATGKFNNLLNTEVKVKNKHGKIVNPPKKYGNYSIFEDRKEAEKYRKKAIRKRAVEALQESTYELQKVTSHIKATEDEDMLKEFVSIKNSLNKLIDKLK
jgi:hypothetical protein